MNTLQNLPKWARYVLSLIAGALLVLNQTVFHFGSHWYAGLIIAVTFFAALGIPAITGAQWQDTLVRLFPGHSLTVVRGFLAAGISAAALAISLIHMSNGVKAVITGLIAFLVGIGFPSPPPAPPVAARTREHEFRA